MNKILPITHSTLATSAEQFARKEVIQNKALQKNGKSVLERVATKEFLDVSTEEMGYFTRRNEHGEILGIIKVRFPR